MYFLTVLRAWSPRPRCLQVWVFSMSSHDPSPEWANSWCFFCFLSHIRLELNPCDSFSPCHLFKVSSLTAVTFWGTRAWTYELGGGGYHSLYNCGSCFNWRVNQWTLPGSCKHYSVTLHWGVLLKTCWRAEANKQSPWNAESLALCACMLSCFSRVWLCTTLRTVSHQTPLSLEFPGKNTEVGCHLLQGIFPASASNPSLPLAPPSFSSSLWISLHKRRSGSSFLREKFIVPDCWRAYLYNIHPDIFFSLAVSSMYLVSNGRREKDRST